MPTRDKGPEQLHSPFHFAHFEPHDLSSQQVLIEFTEKQSKSPYVLFCNAVTSSWLITVNRTRTKSLKKRPK